MSSSLIKSVGLQLVTALACAPAYSSTPAQDQPALRALLQQRYPGTQFGEIRATPLPGIFQVQLGAQPAYVAADGRHFLFGHLMDMETQTDLSGPPSLPPPPDATLDFGQLPLEDAIKTVRGNGTRRLAVFADPECPYCRELESTLDQIDDITVYTFLLPLTALHPGAAATAESIWCAKDRAAAWRVAMRQGPIAPATCLNPLERTTKLAEAHGISGTPYILFANGQRAVGALDVPAVMRLLGK